MTGMLIDTETGDLLIQNGSVVIGDTDGQVTEEVLVAMRGEYKEMPLVGGEVGKMLNGAPDVMWKGQVKKMLEACGVPVSKITVSDDSTITVE